MKKTYRIYKLENEKTSDEVFKFYLPEEGVDTKTALSRKSKRLLELKDLKKNGYRITADVLVDKEDYLNARLSVAVADYCKYDKDERNLKLFSFKYSEQTLIQCLEMLAEMKRASMKRIVSLIRRLNNEDLDIHNEVAIMLYDQYIKALM